MSNEDPTPAARAQQLMDDHRTTSSRRRLMTTLIVVLAVSAAVLGIALARGSGDDRGEGYSVPDHATTDFGFRFTPALANGTQQADPAVTVALYEDFLCPSCGEFEKRSGEFLREAVESGRIVLEYRPFTFLVGASTNRYSQRAANAAACVADTAGVAAFAAFHDALYADQPEEGSAGPDNAALIAKARAAGAGDVEDCITEETFATWVSEALLEGRNRGVSKTPTVAINESILRVAGQSGGSVIPGPDDLDAAIEQFER